jgi:hypothetical protein
MANTLRANQTCIMLQVRSTPKNMTHTVPKDTLLWERKTLSNYWHNLSTTGMPRTIHILLLYTPHGQFSHIS